MKRCRSGEVVVHACRWALLVVLYAASSCAPGDEVDEATVEEIRGLLLPRMIGGPGEEMVLSPGSSAMGDPVSRADSLAKQYASLLHNRYIVVLDEIAVLTMGDGDPASVASRHGVAAKHVYRHALKGFSGVLDAQQLEALRDNPRVKYIQPDGLMFTTDTAIPRGINRVDADVNPTAAIDGADDRVGVTVAIIDTGIDLDHVDLNVGGGRDFCSLDPDTGGNDLHGHGTHCGGTVGALDNGYDFGPTGNRFAVMGVAPGVSLWAVRVLDENGAGFVSDIIDGINWITGCVDGSDTSCPAGARDIKVANMSLGCECDDTSCWCGDDCSGINCNDALRDAIDAVVAAGVTLVTSAGNDTRNVGTQSSCDVSPSCFDSPVVVAAMTDFDGTRGSLSGCPSDCGYTSNTDDDISSYSNFGAQVDVIAPGTCVQSTYHKTGCNDCALAAVQCSKPKIACVTSDCGPGEYKCCNWNVTHGCTSCSVKHSCPSDKDGLCFDGDDNEYCCVHGPYTVMSGTSMSSPHVVGGAALFIDEYYRENGTYPTPTQVKDGLTLNGDALPCGSGTGSSCTNLPGTPGLFSGEHRDSIEASGYSVDFMLLNGDGFGSVTTAESYHGSRSLNMGVHDLGGGVHGYSCVNFCLSENDLADPIDDFVTASMWVKFDEHTDWTGFGVSGEDSSDTDLWLYWWWIRADGTVFDDVDRFGGTSVFSTSTWHLVEITVDRRDPNPLSHVASLKVDTSEDTLIPLSGWDATTEGMRCLFVFSGVIDDTYQDLYVDRVYVRARPGGGY